ncbi:MAG TPA: acetate uptake transporter [Streptosporangiaceae bacterium]|nr:acetate uptake transporter [Streptosporangiaceae bacterium]
MTITDERPTTVMTTPAADPAPLGLAAFALTTFLLSAANAHWMTTATGDAWLGFAFAYGGLAQFAAGMWEFRNRNVFGATAFGTYGGFWIAIGLWALLVAPPPAGAGPVAAAAHAAAAGKDLGWILLAFAIFNTYMLLWSTLLNWAIFAVFLTLEATEVVLFIGFFANNTSVIKVGGYVGVLTALVAWYASAAIVVNTMRGGAQTLPVGKPLWPARPAA